MEGQIMTDGQTDASREMDRQTKINTDRQMDRKKYRKAEGRKLTDGKYVVKWKDDGQTDGRRERET